MELISHEAIVPMPYRDSVGVWTYGIGHTRAAGSPKPSTMSKGVATTIDEVIAVFKKDIIKYEDGVNKAVKIDLKQHEFDALVSFHYNTGAIARATATKKLNLGDRVGAAKSLISWNKPPEIIERRRKEQKLFLHGEYASDGMVTVYQASSSGKVKWSSAKRIDISQYFGGIEVSTTERSRPVIDAGDRNDSVKELQRILGLHDDGIFGPQTKAAVIDFQKDNGLVADGVVGKKTWKVLDKM